MGYTKLFNEILASTIWDEEMYVKVVWITVLAMKNERNQVMASVPGVAHMARVSIEQAQKAIDKFLAPDQYSRSKENDGRRLEIIDGGWHILNGEKYKRKMSEDERREYNKLWMRNHRESLKQEKHVDSTWTNVNNVDKSGRSVTTEQNRKEQNRTSMFNDQSNNINPITSTISSVSDGAPSDQFLQFWKKYPNKVGKLDCIKIWKRMKLNSKIDAILGALDNHIKSTKWTEEGGKFIPNPSTWLNQGRWLDEVHKQKTWEDAFDERVKK